MPQSEAPTQTTYQNVHDKTIYFPELFQFPGLTALQSIIHRKH